MIIGSPLDERVSFPQSDDEWYSFLYSPHGEYDAFRTALRLKRMFDDLPKTAATIPQKTITKKYGIHRNQFDERMMHLLGSWKVPDYYPAQGDTKWVNPHHPHRYRYSDAEAMCECGIPVLREGLGENFGNPLDINDHRDECCRRYRIRARADLWDARADVIEQMISLGNTYRETMYRLGYNGKKSDHGVAMTRKCGLDPEELAREGRRRAVRTFGVLLRDYATGEVAEFFDVTNRMVTTALKDESTMDAGTLYKFKRRHRNGGWRVEGVEA